MSVFSRKFLSRLVSTAIALSISAVFSPLFVNVAEAGQGQSYRINSGASYSGKRPVVRRYHNRRHNNKHNNKRRYNGPLVINVQQALAQRSGVYGVTKPNSNRHVIEGIGGTRVLYYNDSQCDKGYDCVIRLGNKTSSPKIVIVGERRKVDESAAPHIIYPPNRN